MKKLTGFLSTLLLCSVFIFATSCSDDDDDKRIDFDQLPLKSQTFVKTYFKDAVVSKVEQDKNGYDVDLVGNIELDFDLAGNMVKVDVGANPMPQGIMLLLPVGVTDYISAYHANRKVSEVELKASTIEVELYKDHDLIFDVNGRILQDHGGIHSPEVVDPSVLPAASRDFLATHFPSATIIKIEKESDKYDVDLSDGSEIDFYLDGSMKSVDVTAVTGVPQAIMMESITSYIAANYAGRVIVEYSKLPAFFVGEYANGYKVELSGQPEIDVFFNSNGEYLNAVLD